MKEVLTTVINSLKGSNLVWNIDNWAASRIVEVGSMKEHLQSLAVEINQLVWQNNIQLKMEWRPRTDSVIQYWDYISKDFDTADYFISSQDFKFLREEFGPFLADFFASHRSFRMKPFYSRMLHKESAGVDAFAQCWTSVIGILLFL